jgi:hypothetical protein
MYADCNSLHELITNAFLVVFQQNVNGIPQVMFCLRRFGYLHEP